MGSYAKFVRVLEKWPLDPPKKGKDIGEKLRVLFQKSYPQGSVTPVDEVNMNRQIEALQRLVDNTYQKQYPRSSTSNFTMLEQEVLHQITSVEIMGQTTAESEQERPGLLQRIRNYRFL